MQRFRRNEGGKLGDGIGRLYTRTSDKRWLLTLGFTDKKLAEFRDEDYDDDNDFNYWIDIIWTYNLYLKNSRSFERNWSA